MLSNRKLLAGAGIAATFLLTCLPGRSAETSGHPLVRLAELEIDPAQLEAYKAALKEEIAASIRLEPGVLTLYAVSINDHPNQIRLFEQYRDRAAYNSHVKSPHFLRYRFQTQSMVRSLKLLETTPILLGSR